MADVPSYVQPMRILMTCVSIMYNHGRVARFSSPYPET